MDKTHKSSLPGGNISDLSLRDGSEIAVIGGGPAGSFFAYFTQELAGRIGLTINVDVYEEKNFSLLGPAGCNHCGGIISESLVQILAGEGIVLPTEVLQRGIESYTLHMDAGSVRIDTPREEKRIAAVFRGSGPLGTQNSRWSSFDGFLLKLVAERGATIRGDRVERLSFKADRPIITTREGTEKTYDLVVGAVGLKASSLRLFEEAGFDYHAPGTTKTYITEFHLGYETIEKYFGDSMHVFLLNIPRLEFAALIPKGDYVTLVLLGNRIDKELVTSFLKAPEVMQCFPPGYIIEERPPCQCYPSINIKSARNMFADRVVLIGDCATSKLYKNGIGAAYITAKAAATTVLFKGVSNEDFRKHYLPVCRKLRFDNLIGKGIFVCTCLIQKTYFSKRGIQRRITKEQNVEKNKRYLSSVLWDTFTGSAPYKNILLRMMNPRFFLPLVYEITAGFFLKNITMKLKKKTEEASLLGKLFQDGEIIVRQGEEGDCMYVIQSGTVEVLQEKEGRDVHLAELGKNNFFGEMALFEREVRSATVRSKGQSCILTVDKKTFLGRIQDDPSMAFRIIEKMSSRIRQLNGQLSRIKASDRRNWETRDDNWKPSNK